MYPTGCSAFDELLSGGFEEGSITTVYGPASTGKTTACMMVAAKYAKDGKVVYIDTEKGFHADRFEQISKDKKIMDNLLLLSIQSFEKLQESISKLEELSKNSRIKLIIIDTIGNHYRVRVNEEPKETNKQFVQMMRALVHLSRDQGKTILLANQVYSKLEGDVVEPVGGKLLKKFNANLIELNMDEHKNRYAILRKHKTEQNIGKQISFTISNEGIVVVQQIP